MTVVFLQKILLCMVELPYVLISANMGKLALVVPHVS